MRTVAVAIAEPEKALLDHWHLTPGEWTRDRLGEMRYQQVALVDLARLDAYAERWCSPRLRRAVTHWVELAASGALEEPA